MAVSCEVDPLQEGGNSLSFGMSRSVIEKLFIEDMSDSARARDLFTSSITPLSEIHRQ